MAIWPTFAAYAVSFAFVAIIWVNHHHLVQSARKVDALVLWTNLVGMLFSMSFIPFASAYLAEHIKNALPVAVYGGLFAACLTGFIALSSAIAHHRLPQNEEGRRDASAARKNVVVLAAYLVAIPIAFLSTWTALAIVVVVSAFFVLPTTWPASPKP